jgi:hypothetical protein
MAAAESETLDECPRQESNLHPALRRRVLYPLSYEGGAELPPPDGGYLGSRRSLSRAYTLR